MVVCLPQSKQDAVKQRLLENTPHIAIAEEMSTLIQIVKNYSAILKYHDVVLLSTVSRIGRLPTMICEIVNVCFPKLRWALQVSFYDRHY